MPERTTASSSHMLECYEWEKSQTACLNEGKCFVVTGHNGARHAACKCTPQFTGERCQEFFIDPAILNLEEKQIRTAHVTAAVSVCVLVFFVVLLMIYVYIKYRRKSHLPPEAIRGPKLEIREYYNYNEKVPWLSSSQKKESQVQTPNSAVTENDTKLPLSNGPDGLDTAPLIQPKFSENGRLGAVPENNNNVSSAPLVDPNQSYNPPDSDDFRYIDESTLPRPHKKSKANDAESQL